MTLTEQLNADVEGTEADLKVLFSVNGRGSFIGQKTTPLASREIVEDGYETNIELELIYRLVQFTATFPAPKSQDRIKLIEEGKSYRVESVRTAEDGVTATALLSEDI
jgi:hypothetical protein